MCGIFGVITKEGNDITPRNLRSLKSISKSSERRGSDASGLILDLTSNVTICRINSGITKLWNKSEISEQIRRSHPSAIIGHTRLSTHGIASESLNNQPAVSSNWCVVHNGIILNHKDLLEETIFSGYELDTYVINQYLEEYGSNRSHLTKMLNQLPGEITFVALNRDGEIIAFTNVGNLYLSESLHEKFLASEPNFLPTPAIQIEKGKIEILRKSSGMLSRETSILDFHEKIEEVVIPGNVSAEGDVWDQIRKLAQQVISNRNAVKRCSQCVLPNNFPSMEIDPDGVCIYCRNWVNPQVKGEFEFKQNLRAMSKVDRRVLVNFSGGRDSSYSLIKIAQMGFQPIAFTYDWGFISNAARENMSRLCQMLGVEHVLISPNLRKNREIAGEVLKAWLKKPDVGVIPLLMAGDKFFHTLSMQVSKERGNLPILHSDHYLETTGFKSMLGGAQANFSNHGRGVTFQLSKQSLFKMAVRYFRFVSSAQNLRISIFRQLASSFISYYVVPHKFVRFFDYFEWKESEIDLTVQEFGWKSNRRTHSSKWRMGDATAPLYNFLYLIELGFTENDAMLSNQIRAGLITRNEALNKLFLLNKPDFDGLAIYLDIVSVSNKLMLNYLVRVHQHL